MKNIFFSLKIKICYLYWNLRSIKNFSIYCNKEDLDMIKKVLRYYNISKFLNKILSDDLLITNLKIIHKRSQSSSEFLREDAAK